MNALKGILLSILALCAFLFLYQNWTVLSQSVSVTFRLPLLEIRPMPPQGPPVHVMLVASFAVGFFSAYLLGLYRRMQSALELRRLRKQVAERPSRGERTAPVETPSVPAPAPADEESHG